MHVVSRIVNYLWRNWMDSYLTILLVRCTALMAFYKTSIHSISHLTNVQTAVQL